MLCVLALSACAPTAAAGAVGTVRAEIARLPVESRSVGRRRSSTARAPSEPPLATGENGAERGGEEGAGDAPQVEADPLVSNGLGSPLCKETLGSELALASRRDCETSGFAAAPAPTGDYGLDVHIDTGVLSPSSWLPSITQDTVVTPLWMALVWAVHALVVMLEWSFTMELVDGDVMASIGSGLRQMQVALTDPWLPLALAATAMITTYHGLVRRRVADTLGEALLTIAMMVAGIGIIIDPSGTVGALGRWANQASLGTLAVATRGSPDGPRQVFAGGLGALFATVIEAPWCYLEFGNVSWCRESSLLDPRLRAAALRIAAEESSEVSCEPAAALAAPCTPAGSEQAKLLEHSIELLRDARSNGAIFLALPANDPARNSINEEGSLLRTLCQSSEVDGCRGPTAAQAEFRTGGETWFRLGGLLLIAGGLLGMLLLIGFVALRLLRSAAFGVFYLLLAPALVLAPAFGERGRALFRRWLLQLFDAVVSKLVFAFLLGVVLAVLAILSRLYVLGWWTQWLLTSAFWWGAFLHRHQAFGVAADALGGRRAVEHGPRSIARRMSAALEVPGKGVAIARKLRERRSDNASEERRRTERHVGGELAQARLDEQMLRTLESGRREASAHAEAAPALQHRLAGRRSQLARLDRERTNALVAGDTRRAAEIAHRKERVSGEIAHEQVALNAAQRAVRDSERAKRRTGATHTRDQRDAQSSFLDAQMRLAPGAEARAGEQRRDYAALAGLAGYGREEYERLAPRSQRAARLEIDRELASRRELSETATAPGAVALDRRARRPARSADADEPAWLRAAERSSVMRDAHEVAARRKRQLGKGRL
jgi:hypothetical protein